MSSGGGSEFDAERALDFERRVREDGRYPPEAFEFLHRGLARAAERRHGAAGEPAARHVSGQELCHALRELALQRWGPLAPTVLGSWNVHRTRDFGEMVFLMIEWQLMGKQESDRIEDFDDVFDFRTAFNQYDISLDVESDE